MMLPASSHYTLAGSGGVWHELVGYNFEPRRVESRVVCVVEIVGGRV